MLEREHRGRRQHRHLLAVHHGLEGGAHRHLGLAVADVAAEQAVHRHRRFHVALDVGDGGRLIDGQLVGEGAFELLLPVRVGAEGVTRDGPARGVELEQLLGHVAHGLLHLRLGALPGRAAEPVERRPRAAAVLLDQVEPLDRDEELVVAVIAQLEELLDVVADRDLLQPDELADAVVHVHDQIADLQIAQVGQKGGRRRALAQPLRSAPALFLEDVGGRVAR